MKFPKLKHGLACVLFILLPLILVIVLILIWASANEVSPNGCSDAAEIIAILGGGGSLYFFFENLGLYLVVDGAREVVDIWKNARMYYQTDCNGKDRKIAEDKILRRMKLCGKEREVCISEITPIAVRRSCRGSMTVNYRAIEKMSVVYSVSELDEKTYQTIMTSAKRNIQKTHKEPKHSIFEDKEQRKAPVAVVTAVIILADRISEKIPELVWKKQSSPVGAMLVCVGDMSCGRYYFDSEREPNLLGMKPEKNFAFDTVKRLVFGGRLPLKGNDNYLLTTDEHKRAQEMSETVLWDFLREMRKELVDSEKEQKKIAESLSSGEARLIDDEIYCKLGENVTSCPVEVDEADTKKLTVYQFDQWFYPKNKTMAKKDMEATKMLIEKHLLSEGYTVIFKDFSKYCEGE